MYNDSIVKHKAKSEMTQMNKAVVGTTEMIITQIVNIQIRDMVNYIESTFQFKLPLKVRLSFSTKRNRSWGGVTSDWQNPKISLALNKYKCRVWENDKCSFPEYASYAGDRHIGSLFNVTWQKATATLVAHELAHAIQWYVPNDVVCKVIGNIANDRGHGEYFRAIYRHLRLNLINNVEFDVPYTYIAVPSVKSVQVEKPKREKKTGMRMEIRKTPNGWFVHEYFCVVSGELLGKMASKPRFASQGWISGKWETLLDGEGKVYPNHPAARKAFLGK